MNSQMVKIVAAVTTSNTAIPALEATNNSEIFIEKSFLLRLKLCVLPTVLRSRTTNKRQLTKKGSQIR